MFLSSSDQRCYSARFLSAIWGPAIASWQNLLRWNLPAPQIILSDRGGTSRSVGRGAKFARRSCIMYGRYIPFKPSPKILLSVSRGYWAASPSQIERIESCIENIDHPDPWGSFIKPLWASVLSRVQASWKHFVTDIHSPPSPWTLLPPLPALFMEPSASAKALDSQEITFSTNQGCLCSLACILPAPPSPLAFLGLSPLIGCIWSRKYKAIGSIFLIPSRWP